MASPANPTYTVEELARQLKDSGAKALITQVPFLDSALKAAQQAGLPKDRVLLMGDEKGHGLRHWGEVTAEKAWVKPGRTKVDPKKDLAYLVYSSVSA